MSNSSIICSEGSGVELDPGPACENTLFPMCSESTWRYDVIDLANMTAEPSKSWSIMGMASNLDLSFDDGVSLHEKSMDSAWDYCRSSSEDVRHAWISQDSDIVYWENSSWHAPDGTRTKESYYEPRRVRAYLDPETLPEWESLGSLPASGPWVDEYTEWVSEEGVISRADCTVKWHRSDVPTELAQDPRFKEYEVACETSKTECCVADCEDPEIAVIESETAIFCFAAGIGKVWEYTYFEAEESLADWNVSVPESP